MKIIVVLVLLLYHALSASSQTIGNYRSFDPNQSNINVLLTDSLFEVYETYNVSVDIISTRIYLSATCKKLNDTVVIFKENKPICWLRIGNDYLEVLTDGILGVNKGTKLYKMDFYDSEGRVLMTGGHWSEGKRDGYWLFFDTTGIPAGHILFKEGVIIDTIKLNYPVYNLLDTIP